jgi:hypothetical protein
MLSRQACTAPVMRGPQRLSARASLAPRRREALEPRKTQVKKRFHQSSWTDG